MPSVELTFVSPDDRDLAALLIYESPTQGGAYTQIERVTAIGQYPDYITEWTTNKASQTDHWFAIAWEDAKGAQTKVSLPVQGGETLLVAKIVQRMRERDASISAQIAKQEAEASIQTYYGDAVDPYSVTLKPSYRITNGLVYLALARVYASRPAAGAVDSATIGLVSFKTGSSQKANIDELLAFANRELGLSFSTVMLMKEISVAGGQRRLAGVDLSRLLVEVQ